MAALVVGMAMQALGCGDGACSDLVCIGGSEVECECICDAFHEGEACDELSRHKFLGTNWYNSRTCSSGSLLVAEITAGSDDSGAVMIHNVHETGDQVHGEVSGDTLRIPTQVHGLEYIEGEGIYSQGDITIQYKIIETGGQETPCVAQFTR